MKSFNLLLLISIVLLSVSCADNTAISMCVEQVKEPVYGFWSGLIHGWIIFFSFIGSLFNEDVSIYAVNNTGGWYDLGFLLGVGSLGSGVTITRSK